MPADLKPEQKLMGVYTGLQPSNARCCKHWRVSPGKNDSPIPMQRFKETITDLAELGCKKIHFSGGERKSEPT
ncbi:MAG: hypothetical protein IPN96_03625 [Anaerolineales bacterium]|nr:hypothetical protein [Anaerolineales bacterium]